MGDKGPGSKGGGKKPKTSTKKKGAAPSRPSCGEAPGRPLVGSGRGVRLDDGVAAEDERLGDLVSVGAAVPLLEARVVVVRVMAFVVLEDASDEVLDRAVNLARADVELGQRRYAQQPAIA